ncbi:MAG: efflux RND transporter permease subunit [Proteobacteria bacterium]|nr:MAG: efflux RND transporter permease subunit [Pseudomonadota bacterium]
MLAPGSACGRCRAVGSSSTSRTGLIATFARHPTAANLLFALMVVCGLFATVNINRQFFPDFGIDFVTISVVWPGASAEDIDSNIVQAIEPEVRFLNGVKTVTSSSFESIASISVEFEAGHTMADALSDVESAVAQLRTLPEDSEEPEIRRIIRYETISKLVISGPFPESSLKYIAKNLRDDLLDLGVDRIDLFGARDEEIWVDIEPAILRRFDLKLADIAARIGASSQDLPSGEIAGGQQQVRSLGLKRTAAEVEAIEIKAFADGRKVFLRDIATVHEAFNDSSRVAFRHGQPAIELHIRRAVNTDALDIAETVKKYITGIKPTLPPTLTLEQYDVRAKSIQQRIQLLVNNGLGGLALVLAVLFLFLNARVAFWVAAGIPAAMLAAVGVMWVSGQTINMISMFGMIMAIGIVVDDAIVVGEHAETRFRQGLDPLDAAVAGAHRMAAPVVSATLTTIAAFLPLFLISGIMGQIISAIPFVVVAVLLASLLECFFVLPGHLRHALRKDTTGAGRLSRFRGRFDAAFDGFREGTFTAVVTRAVRFRYITIAISIAAFVIALGSLIGGQVGYQFFPSPEPDKIYANIEMSAGTSRDRTRLMMLEVEQALYRAAVKLDGDNTDLIEMSLGKLGVPVGDRQGGSAVGTSDTVGGIVVELKTSDQRTVRAAALMAAWRREVHPQPGLETFTVTAQQTGPPGRDLDIRLRGGSVQALKSAAAAVAELLARFPGLTDIDDNLPVGKPEVILEVTSRGQALGFTTAEIGRQVRNAIDGAIAKRFPRRDEEVWIRVQLDRKVVNRAMLDKLYVRSPAGVEVPLGEVVTMRKHTGFARIRREDGRREVSITAEVDPSLTSASAVIRGLLEQGLVDIVNDYGVDYEFSGRAEEQAETTADMQFGALLGLVLIYIILAWVFSSYVRPLVVMSIIPLGLVGAVIGHFLWGADLTILSVFALLGLAGIVINDSIVLVTTIDERYQTEPLDVAAINGARDRLRAVVLTSATTIGGLSPLLFETSLQAQFLIPMAITIVFGLLVTTFVVLLLVPALVVVQGDIARLLAGRNWLGMLAHGE